MPRRQGSKLFGRTKKRGLTSDGKGSFRKGVSRFKPRATRRVFPGVKVVLLPGESVSSALRRMKYARDKKTMSKEQKANQG